MRVVHCKREPYTHYIGRPHRKIPKKHWGVFGSPFPIHDDSQREMSLIYYERYARANVIVLEAIILLPEDAVLGCWCTPKLCHGEIIMEIWREEHQ